MASARHQLGKEGLRSATAINRQKLKQPASPTATDRPNSGLIDQKLPRSSGDASSGSSHKREEMISKLGERFFNAVVVLIQQAARSSNQASFQDIADGIFNDASNYIKTEQQLEALAYLLYCYGLEDVNMSETSAKICTTLANLEINGKKLRSPLFSLLQDDFEKRSVWKDEDPARFLAYCSFLCCIFCHMRVAGKYVLRLVEPVYTCLDYLLTDQEGGDDEIQCGCKQLKELGLVLDDLESSKMDLLVNAMKERLLGPNTSQLSRLLLLEVVELRASGWQLTDTQKMYYSEVFC